MFFSIKMLEWLIKEAKEESSKVAENQMILEENVFNEESPTLSSAANSSR
jgi:hypothetical protein